MRSLNDNRHCGGHRGRHSGALRAWRLASVLSLLLLLVSFSASLGADTPEPGDSDEIVETGPVVIDEVFLGTGNITAFLEGIQWLEIVNPTDEAFSVDGLWLFVNDKPFIALDPWRVIEPDGYLVLVVLQQPIPYMLPLYDGDEDFPIQVVESQALPKQEGVLALGYPALAETGTRVDAVDVSETAEQIPFPGTSFSLDPSFLSVEGNNDPAHWCAGLLKTSLLGHLVNGTPGDLNPQCDGDGDGFTKDDGDCNDDDSDVSPEGVEICDGVDNDCDDVVDDVGWVDAGSVLCLQEGVCIGTAPQCVEGAWLCTYPEGFEDHELSCDGLDNDCDGETDETLLNVCGLCGAVQAETCDGLDNDCDGATDEGLVAPKESCPLDRGLCEGAAWVCGGDEGWRCDYGFDYEPEEDRCDGLDNDCDGETDEGFPTGGLCMLELGACKSSGVWVCAANASEIVCAAPPIGLDEELCGDGVDNDCNGEVDEGYPIGDACEVGQGACRVTGRMVCADDDRSVVCDATPLPPSDEWCSDGLDNDCDGETDEAACATEPDSPDDGKTVLGGGGVRGCATGSYAGLDVSPWATLALALLALLVAVGLRRSTPRP